MRSPNQDPPGSDTSSNGTPDEKPHPVWVLHAPTPEGSSTGGTSSTVPYMLRKESKPSLKTRLQNLLNRSQTPQHDDSDGGDSGFQTLPNGTRVSPPVSPLCGRKHDVGGSDSGQYSDKNCLPYEQEESLLTSIHPAEHYAEKVEIYNLKYGYLKSWPGLLRLLAGMQLLFGGMVFACVIAYVHRDSEWSNAFGIYNGAHNDGYGFSGYTYHGPMTPFVLVIAGVSWIITFVLLVVGMTMYYRTILLDSPWWPLTEAFINLAVCLLFMSAGIVYLNDLNRGGLCFTIVGVNPILASLCHVEGGQMAGTAFIFINMVLYLGSFLICLKMWRHEAARRAMENYLNEPRELLDAVPQQKPKRISFRDQTDAVGSGSVDDPDSDKRGRLKPSVSPSRGTSESHRRVDVIADFIMRYPQIRSAAQREEYRAVFYDQYPEYRDLHRDVNLTLSKFRQLDAAMERLQRDRGTSNQRRIQSLRQMLERKKNDPCFRDKKERCDYLKAKLGHLKNQIRSFDQTSATRGPQ